MPFHLSESHIANYMSDGYTVFRGIIPASLIKDLRLESIKGRELARAKHGAQAQRIQPIGSFNFNPKPFQDYAELPELLDAIRQVISPDAWHGTPEWLGILIEPASAPWCTKWHRDITADSAAVDPKEFESVRYQQVYFNQTNCALYDDSSTWIVPGSHCREDVPSELAHMKKWPLKRWGGEPEPGVSHEEQEQRCIEYCRNMPRAVCLHLDAGDFALYRPLAWHLGNYTPYRIRATLHDAVWTPQSKEWYDRWEERRGKKAYE